MLNDYIFIDVRKYGDFDISIIDSVWGGPVCKLPAIPQGMVEDELYKLLKACGFRKLKRQSIQLTDDMYCVMDVPNDKKQRVSIQKILLK